MTTLSGGAEPPFPPVNGHTPKGPDVSDVRAAMGPGSVVAMAEAARPVGEKPPFNIIRVRDIADPGPVKWLVQDLWTTAAFGIVGAEPKSWKSWLTLYLAICVASGRKAFDRFDVDPGLVLIFSAEGGNGLVRQRVAMLCEAMEMEIPEDLFVIDTPTLRLDQPETAARILSTVQSARPKLLILDPLRELHQGDENDAADVARLLAPLRSLQAEGTACMLVHHLGKQSEGARKRGGQRGGQRLRGSSALHGAVDSALYLETNGDGEKKRVTVQAEHRAAVEPAPFVLKLNSRKFPSERVWLEIVNEEEEQKEKELQKEQKVSKATQDKMDQIVRAVAAAWKKKAPLDSKREILKAVKGTRDKVYDLIDDMVGDELIACLEGVYMPIEAAHEMTPGPGAEARS